MVRNGASSHKINYMDFFSEILNLKGHINRCISLKFTTILLNGWILPTGGVASGRVCPAACTAVWPVFHPFRQIIPPLELNSQLQLSLWSDPITFCVPKSTQ